MLLVALLLGGCTLLDNTPKTVPVFDLRLGTVVPDPGASPGDAVEWQLAVDEPAALAPVSGARIVTRAPDGGLGVLAGGSWAARGPELVQAVLVEGFARSGRITAATRLGSGARGDCTLLSDLRDFQYDQASRTVQLTLGASLTCGPAGQVVAARAFSQAVAVEGRGLGPVVAAFQQGAAMLVPELVDWTLAAGTAASR